MINGIAEIRWSSRGARQGFLTGLPAMHIAKEIRLLLPAWWPALLLVAVSACIVHGSWFLAHGGLLFGLLLVSVACFGREFSLRTFPLLLAQPSERATVWWTKIGVLAAAFGVLFGVWWTGCCLTGATNTLLFDAAGAAAIFSGGLWTTLLTRQATAAFWFTILIPVALMVFITSFVASEIALAMYAVAGFLLAWRLFFRAQEVSWAGGALVVAGWRSSARTQAATRSRRPYSALLRKELQLQQVSIVGMIVLFVLHLGAVYVRDTWDKSLDGSLRALLEVFAVAWVFVPLVIASSGVAEERKLGTLAGNLCLPVPARVQFAVKFFVAFVLGAVGCAILGGVAEGVASVREIAPQVYLLMALLLPLITFVCFYASTLAGNLIQAVAVTGLIVVAGYLSHFLSSWVGALLYLVVWPSLIVASICLGLGNFRTVTEGWNLWRRNLRGLGLTLALSTIACAGVHHRVWELLTAQEPAHGPAVLTSGRIVEPNVLALPPVFAVLAPDGSLYCESVPTPAGIGNVAGAGPSGGRLSGSNWLDVAVSLGTIVAIRTDGSLWTAPAVVGMPNEIRPAQSALTPTIEANSNWTSVATYATDFRTVLLLKGDGSLWVWLLNPLQARFLVPRRVGTDSDWTRIASHGGVTYAWRKSTNGRAAYTGNGLTVRALYGDAAGLTTDDVLRRAPEFDRFGDAKSLTHFAGNGTATVGSEGTLWVTAPYAANAGVAGRELGTAATSQIGQETNWTKVAGNYWTLVALKSDGSMWEWSIQPGESPQEIARSSPRRLSSHHDWVAAAVTSNGIITLAADGSLWCWPDANGRDYSWNLLVPTRKPVRLRNILAQAN